MADGHEIQRKIFGAISASGDLTVSKLAAMLRTKEHVIRYQLHRLLKSETIHRTVLINQRALGMLVCTIFFDLPPLSEDSVVAFLKKRREVWWFAKFHGSRKYEVSIVARDAGQIERLVNELGEETGVHVRNQQMVLSEDRYEWGMRFLSPEYHSRTPYILRRGESYDGDEVDLKIMRELYSDSYATTQGLARDVGIASSSLAYRLAKLRKAGVISDDIYEVKRDGQYVNAVLLVSVKARSKQTHAKMLEFCQDHPHVKGLTVEVGCWDYRVSLYGDRADDLLRTADTFSAKLSRIVESVSVFLRREILRTAAGV